MSPRSPDSNAFPSVSHLDPPFIFRERERLQESRPLRASQGSTEERARERCEHDVVRDEHVDADLVSDGLEQRTREREGRRAQRMQTRDEVRARDEAGEHRVVTELTPIAPHTRDVRYEGTQIAESSVERRGSSTEPRGGLHAARDRARADATDAIPKTRAECRRVEATLFRERHGVTTRVGRDLRALRVAQDERDGTIACKRVQHARRDVVHCFGGLGSAAGSGVGAGTGGAGTGACMVGTGTFASASTGTQSWTPTGPNTTQMCVGGVADPAFARAKAAISSACACFASGESASNAEGAMVIVHVRVETPLFDWMLIPTLACTW